jgi:hypothetical protein
MDQPISPEKSTVSPKDDELREPELVERLIKETGSKRAAIRAIQRAKTKGNKGRRKGQLQYLEADTQILWLVASLQLEWVRRCGTSPSSRNLIRSLLKLCWRGPAPPKLSVGRDLLRCCDLGGADKDDAVITRLLGRKLVWAALADQQDTVRLAQARSAYSRNGIDASLSITTSDLKREVKTYTPPLELFEALHQQCPELGLLPKTRSPIIHKK